MPRYVCENDAAEYLGIPVSKFRHLQKVGCMPGRQVDVGLYDIKALDLACDRLSGLGGPENALDDWLDNQGGSNGLRPLERRSHRTQKTG